MLEKRTWQIDGFGYRDAPAAGIAMTAYGYLAKFNVPSVDLGFTEYIEPGAFDETILTDDIRFLFNHDPNMLLGRNKSGTLRLSVDAIGLLFEADLPDDELGRRVSGLMRRGDLTGCSFGFNTVSDRWNYDQNTRWLEKIKLFDGSVVVYPAYEQTNAQVRAIRPFSVDGSGHIVERPVEERAATGSATLPLAGRTDAFDQTGARPRIAKWASSDGSGDKDKIDWAKYRQAFFWVDPAATDNVTSYKLVFADVVGGTLKAFPRGVFLAGAVMQGARGGVDIPDADRASVKAKIASYYSRMAKEFDDDTITPPWEEKNSAEIEALLRSVTALAGIETREGKVLRKELSDKLGQAHSLMSEVMDALVSAPNADDEVNSTRSSRQVGAGLGWQLSGQDNWTECLMMADQCLDEVLDRLGIPDPDEQDEPTTGTRPAAVTQELADGLAQADALLDKVLVALGLSDEDDDSTDTGGGMADMESDSAKLEAERRAMEMELLELTSVAYDPQEGEAVA